MDEPLLMLPDMDLAIMGVCETWDGGTRVQRIVYDVTVIIDILIEDHGMDPDEAHEYVLFNIESAYVGPHTPILVWPLGPGEIEHEYSESIRPSGNGEDHIPFKSGRIRARSKDRTPQNRLLRIHSQSGLRGQGTRRQTLSLLERRKGLSLVQNTAQSGVSLPRHDGQRNDEGS
jgi:hypothetical protein